LRAAGRRHKHDSCELATAVDLFEPSISVVEAISAMQDQIMIRNARFVAGNVVKVTLQDETRRFDLLESASFSDFKTLIVERFLIGGDDFSVQYKDEDGDLVTVSSDAELHEAIDCMGVKGSVRFVLTMTGGSSGMQDAVLVGESPKRRKDNELSSSDVDSSKHARKHGKKCSKKEEKTSKKEALKRELIEELRKEFGSAKIVDSNKPVESGTSPSAEPMAMDDSVPSAPSPQIPSGEKLQALLQAGVESLGVPPHYVYNFLNDLTPEKVRDSLSTHSSFPHIFRMMLSHCGMQAGFAVPDHGGRPTFQSPPYGGFAFPPRGCSPGHGPPGYGPHGPPGHGPHGPPGHGPHGPPGHGPHGPPGHGPRGPPCWQGPPAWSGCFPWPPHNGSVPSAVPVSPTSATSPTPAGVNGSVPVPPPPQQGGWGACSYMDFRGGRGMAHLVGDHFGRYAAASGHFPMSMQSQSLDQLPPLPAAPLQFGSLGDEVAALQSILVALGYLHCGPWHLARKTFGKRTYEAILR
jgi:hypothetical protein